MGRKSSNEDRMMAERTLQEYDCRRLRQALYLRMPARELNQRIKTRKGGGRMKSKKGSCGCGCVDGSRAAAKAQIRRRPKVQIRAIAFTAKGDRAEEKNPPSPLFEFYIP
jgi:hypothetical protein